MSKHIEGEIDPYPVTITYEFPTNTFVDNIGVRRSGELLVTVFRDGVLNQVDPSRKDRKPALIHRFPGSAPRRMRQFSIGNYGTPAAIGKIADITHAAFLSGAALLDRSTSTRPKSSSGFITDFSRKSEPEFAEYPALNGVKLHQGYVYLSNSEAHNFFGIKTDSSGEPRGELEILQKDILIDDFTFDSERSVYLTTHPFNSLVKLSADGTRRRIAAGPNEAIFAGPTAAAFRRTETDRTALYVVTDGGIINHVGVRVGPGRMVRR